MTEPQIGDAAKIVCEAFSELDAKVITTDISVVFIRIEASRVMRGLTGGVAVFVLAWNALSNRIPNDPRWLDRITRSDTVRNHASAPIKILVILGKSTGEIRKFIAGTTFAEEGHPVISFDRLRTELVANSPAAARFRSFILRAAPFSSLNPYQIRKTADPGMFFGRQRELAEILQSKNHIFLLGPRRIGKSSLVRELQRRIGYFPPETFPWHTPNPQDPQRRGVSKCCYVDVSQLGVRASEDIWEQILLQFGFRVADFSRIDRMPKLLATTRQEKRTPLADPITVLAQLIRKFPSQLTIVLDEVDEWIQQEALNGWQALSRLRSLTEDYARVVFVGYQNSFLRNPKRPVPILGPRSNTISRAVKPRRDK